MSDNSFGHLFRTTTFGESHGPAIGCVIDGTPPCIDLDVADIQPYLDQRKPGTSRFVTQRKEADKVQILSGVFEGKTTGTPILLLIENTDQRSKDYGDIASVYRPGHADYTYDAKYGIRDYRGGGRSSARETAARVAAGAVARKVLSHRLGYMPTIRGCVVQIGDRKIDPKRWDWGAVNDNPFFCPDAAAAAVWGEYLDDLRKSGSSAGAVIEITASQIPAGLGAPIYGKLDAELAAAMMSINAVKGVEIGSGFALAETPGTEAGDEMRIGTDGKNGGKPVFLNNHAGGILGGISSGQDIVVRFAVKPTSSILTPRRTINQQGDNAEVITKGRHDPCVGIRAVPIGEAMMAIILADQLMRHEAQCGSIKG